MSTRLGTDVDRTTTSVGAVRWRDALIVLFRLLCISNYAIERDAKDNSSEIYVSEKNKKHDGTEEPSQG